MSRLGKRLSYTLNLYGDRPLRLKGTHGTDISSSRLDELDRAAIEWVLQSGSGATGVDAGCGFGIPSVTMALLGAKMVLIDRADFASRFARLAKELPTSNLTFVRADLQSLPVTVLPKRIDLFYSQRTLHYLPFRHACGLLKRISRRMPKGGQGFFSVSGMNSELSEGYAAARFPVPKRFGELSAQMAGKHEIHGPVCLYTEEDVIILLQGAGLRPKRVWKSAFGNVKAVFQMAN